MSPEDRRAAILDATVPLLLERGVDVTTRELAAAAGVAEGTLFRVFPDKQALVHAAVAQMVDPAPLVAELDALVEREPDLGLRELLVQVTTILQTHARQVVQMFGVARQVLTPPTHGPGGHGPGGHGHERNDPTVGINLAVAGLLVPYAAELSRPPAEVAHVLTALALAAVRPGLAPPAVQLVPTEIVDILLDGLLVRAQEAPC